MVCLVCCVCGCRNVQEVKEMLAGEYPMQSLQSHQTNGYLDQANMLFSNGGGELKASHLFVC